MAVNKVIYGETTVIDITDSTVTANKLKSGETAYGADGTKITGSLIVPEVLDDLSDVVIASPQTAQEIYFDGTNWINYGAKIVLTFDDDFRGQTITLTKGQTTITKTAPLSGNTMNLYVNETGTWTISSTISGDTYETEVNVTTFGTSFDAELRSVPPIPEGSTVTPTDDIQTWLACANITDKSYTLLSEVLADRATFETLIADSNACDYMARSTSWALAEGLVPNMTSATTPSGQVISDSDYSGQPNWQAFDGNMSTTWTSNKYSSSSGQCYCGYIFTSEKTIQRIKGKLGKSSQVASTNGGKFQYYNGTDWIDIPNATIPEIASSSNVLDIDIILNEPITANGIRMFQNIPKTYGTIGIYELQFYSNADITTSQDAMSLIGKYDYCSNALLGNATWASAIANSDYSFINPLIPTMTSDTTPSGTVSYSSQYTGLYGYYAFNGNNSQYWSASGWTTTGEWLQYTFDNEVLIDKISYHISKQTGSLSVTDCEVQAFVNEEWTTLATETSVVDATKSLDVNTIKTSKIRVIATGANSNIAVYSLQVNGKATNGATNTNGIIHTANGDTVTCNGNTYVADTNGIIDIDFSQFDEGTYTFTSGIAKDPTDLSNYYSKSFKITKSPYGGTTELYLMPDAVKTLYWYGWDSGLIEDCVSANGWSWSGVGLGTPTHNTNDITLSSAMEGVKSIINGTHKIVVEGVTIVAGTYGFIGATSSKAISGSDWTEFSTSGKLLLSKDISSKYAFAGSVNGRSSKIYAWWYE